MTPRLLRFGERQSPVVVLDEFSGDIGAIVEMAAALAPFPSVQDTYYPGLRRLISERDGAAYAYVEHVLETAAPYIGGAFDLDAFNLVEASFSMVTTPAEALTPPQRAPHFDSTQRDRLALLHYLSPTDGTAFYRQRATGIEIVDDANRDAFVAIARAELERLQPHGYLIGSNAAYEQIGFVEGLADRLVIYSGSLLHSGIIRPDADLSPDPRHGRLTANLFIRSAQY